MSNVIISLISNSHFRSHSLGNVDSLTLFFWTNEQPISVEKELLRYFVPLFSELFAFSYYQKNIYEEER